MGHGLGSFLRRPVVIEQHRPLGWPHLLQMSGTGIQQMWLQTVTTTENTTQSSYTRVGKSKFTVWVCKAEFILVLFINYYIIYLYYNCKSTFAHPCISVIF